MNNNIYINKEMLEDKVTKMRAEKKRIEDAFSRIETDTKAMVSYWQGDSGEKAYNTLSDYTQDFKEIIDTLEIYIKFIEEVLESYEKMDQLINKKMEENASIEVI